MRKKKGNYNFLGRYNHFVPGVPEIVILTLLFLVGAVLGSIVSVVFTLTTSPEASLDYAMLIAYPVMFIPPMIYAVSSSRRRSFNETGIKLDSSNFGGFGFALCALMAAFATLAAGMVTEPVTELLPPMPEWLETTMKSLTGGKLWVNLICVSIFAPVFEEWLCRGMVMRGLLGRGTRPGWAIVISALFFAVIHLNPWQAIPAFVLGCLFGFVYWRTGSLKLTMLMHCVNNTFALIIGHIPSLENAESWKDIFQGPVYWVVFAACVILLVLVVRALLRIPLNGPKGNLDEVPALFSE